jgi:hypothetical protein
VTLASGSDNVPCTTLRSVESLEFEQDRFESRLRRIVVRDHQVGEHDRSGTVLAVEGQEGAKPCLLRWDDTGLEVCDSVVYPELPPPGGDERWGS